MDYVAQIVGCDCITSCELPKSVSPSITSTVLAGKVVHSILVVAITHLIVILEKLSLYSV